MLNVLRFFSMYRERFLSLAERIDYSRYQLLCSTCCTFYLHHILPFKSVTDLNESLNAEPTLSQTKIKSVINSFLLTQANC